MILFVNACVRVSSRTKRLADRLLAGLGGPVREVRPEELSFPKADAAFLSWRDECIQKGDYSDPGFDPAKDFAAAEEIVLAAPYWDLSFPSAVKAYLEQITVTGLTFSYGEDGRPVSHCRAKRLYYVMTAGGPILPPNHGYAYVRDLAGTFFGVPEVILFSAELLDVEGVDAEAQLREAEKQIDEYLRSR